MIIKQPYHVILKETDLIYFAELMLRWPHLSWVKICYELFREKLHPFVITENFLSVKDSCPSCVVIKLPAANFDFEFLCGHFHSLAFKKSNVSSIEKKKPYYPGIPAQKQIKHDWEMCSIKNINTIAPQMAYVICKYGHKRYWNEFDEVVVRYEALSQEVDPCIVRNNRDRSTWTVKNESLWPDSSPFKRQKTPKRKNKDISCAVDLVAKLRENGITDKKQLATMVDNYFPGLLTDAEMGMLLPANPGVIISMAGHRKQGQRLRGIIK